MSQSEEFKKQVTTLIEEFHGKGPFASHISTSAALEGIEGFKEQMDALKDQEIVIRKGLTIFKIDQPPSKEIAKLEVVRIEIIHLIYIAMI